MAGLYIPIYPRPATVSGWSVAKTHFRAQQGCKAGVIVEDDKEDKEDKAKDADLCLMLSRATTEQTKSWGGRHSNLSIRRNLGPLQIAH